MDKYKITLEELMQYRKYYRCLRKCNNVGFKYSVQDYNNNCVANSSSSIGKILSGRIPVVRQSQKTIICERGKKRVITPINIYDRVIQKMICDYVLLPSIAPHLIYDNGASQKGKGVSFARNRINKFIENAKREYGADNLYALVFDFKSYFDSITHMSCYNLLKKYVYDERIVNLTIRIIESYQLSEIGRITNGEEKEAALCKLKKHQGIGICLGSQISQVMAMGVLNDFDHYIKDVLRMKYYERCMDDGVIILNDKNRLHEIMELLKMKALDVGLSFNAAKTQVVKLSRGFTFLKVKYRIDKNGKTLKRLTHDGIVRERRRLKKFPAKIGENKMNLDDAYNSMQSWNSHAKIAQSYTTAKHMFQLYDELLGGYKMTQKYFKRHPEERRRKKVTRF